LMIFLSSAHRDRSTSGMCILYCQSCRNTTCSSRSQSVHSTPVRWHTSATQFRHKASHGLRKDPHGLGLADSTHGPSGAHLPWLGGLLPPLHQGLQCHSRAPHQVAEEGRLQMVAGGGARVHSPSARFDAGTDATVAGVRCRLHRAMLRLLIRSRRGSSPRHRTHRVL
jgi:hypothetical protein